VKKVLFFFLMLCLSAVVFAEGAAEKPAAVKEPAAAQQAEKAVKEPAKVEEAKEPAAAQPAVKAEKAEKTEKTDKEPVAAQPADKGPEAEAKEEAVAAEAGAQEASKPESEEQAAAEPEESEESEQAATATEEAEEQASEEAAAEQVAVKNECPVKLVEPAEKAGGKTKVGVRAALNIAAANVIIVDQEGNEYDNELGIGFEAGLTALYRYSPSLSYSVSVNLISRRVINVGDLPVSADEFSVGIPVALQWAPFMDAGVPVYIEGGLQFDFTPSFKHEGLESLRRSDVDLGLVFGLGGYIGSSFAVDFKGVAGLLDIYKLPDENGDYRKLRNSVLIQSSVGLTYFF